MEFTPLPDDLMKAPLEVAPGGYQWEDLQLNEFEEPKALALMKRAAMDPRIEGANSPGLRRTADGRWVFRALTTKIIQAERKDGWVRDPMRENPHLYREFASLPITEGAISLFADQWGFLGVIEHVRREGLPDWGESFESWKSFIEMLCNMVDVLDMRDHADVTGLSKRFRWEEDGLQYENGKHHWQDFGRIINGKWTDFRVPEQDYQGAANRYLEERASSLLQHSIVHKAVKWDGRNTFQLEIRYRFLLGAIALQFANALTGDRQYRQCHYDGCRRWFVISPETGKRSQSRFCSQSCRQADYYHSEKGREARRSRIEWKRQSSSE
jgi:predicted RNA-binding Zn ribbon-like protein